MVQSEASNVVSVEGRADLLSYGRDVIATQMAAFTVLLSSLDGNFVEAVSSITNLRGRVIATGIGRSSHVARKFAATLSSTGTGALFVHPAEAAHGDLGMLMMGDCLVVFFQSSGIAELHPILRYAANQGLIIIGVTDDARAEILKYVTIKLLLPKIDGPLPAIVAPTVSSMMMALGDALAMTVMHARGTSRSQVEMLHPGGAIGRGLMRVAAIMSRGPELPFVASTAPVIDVIEVITRGGAGMVGVLDESGRLIGSIDDNDLRHHSTNLGALVAKDLMTDVPIIISPAAFIEDALRLLTQHRANAAFVGEDYERPFGIIQVHDLIRAGAHEAKDPKRANEEQELIHLTNALHAAVPLIESSINRSILLIEKNSAEVDNILKEAGIRK